MTSGGYLLRFKGAVFNRSEPEEPESIPTRQALLTHQSEVPIGGASRLGVFISRRRRLATGDWRLATGEQRRTVDERVLDKARPDQSSPDILANHLTLSKFA